MTMISRLLSLVLAASMAFAPSASADRLLLGVGAKEVAGGGALTANYRGYFDSESDLTEYSFGSVTVEPGILLCAVWGAATGGRQLDSVSIDVVGESPVAASKAVASASGQNYIVEFWSAVITAGTSASVEPTFSGAMTRAGVDCWTITGSSQTTYAARSDNPVNSNTGQTSITTTSMDVPAGALTFVAVLNSTASDTITWSQSAGTGTTRAMGGLGTTNLPTVSSRETAQTGALTFTASGANSNWRIGAVAWGP